MVRYKITALAVAASCALATAAHAGGGVAVAPVLVEFAAGDRARSIEVSNPGDEPVDVQVRLFGWRVDEAGDHHDPSRDIGFSPPMFHLAPGARQVVRLAAPAPAAGRENAYRLFVDQLPGPPQAGVLQMPVRMVLPVFVEPPGRVAGRLQWRATRRADGKLTLTAANAGARRVRLVNLGFRADGGEHVVQAGLAGYVLAGQVRTWTVPYAGRGAGLTVTALTEDGPISVPVDAGGG